MEAKEKIGKKVYKPGDIIFHTDLPGERNLLPKLSDNLRWKGHKRREDTGKFIEYIVDDPNAPQPSIDEVPPTDEPLFKTPEEAGEYSRQQQMNKMEHDWQAAHSKKGRPPIGGAQDD